MLPYEEAINVVFSKLDNFNVVVALFVQMIAIPAGVALCAGAKVSLRYFGLIIVMLGLIAFVYASQHIFGLVALAFFSISILLSMPFGFPLYAHFYVRGVESCMKLKNKGEE